MIRLYPLGGEFYNDLADVVRLFYGLEPISDQIGEGEKVITLALQETQGLWHITATLQLGDAPAITCTEEYPCGGATPLEQERLRKRYSKLCLYHLLQRHTGLVLPWGALTGIRPTRLVRQLQMEQRTQSEALAYMRDTFSVRADKLALLKNILDTQQSIYQARNDDQVDVYVGIPFCRTRCLYCSFYSAGIGNDALVEEYVQGLLHEIEAMGAHMAAQHKTVRAIYFGGGTPTAVGDARLQRLLAQVQASFPGAVECTVEAGRPDTITDETFAMLQSMGVGRVSINPQSMNACTLEIIGRSHSPEEIYRAYDLARAAGIRSINMDLIVGLPGEDRAALGHTLQALQGMDMDNLTVHTLAIKRSSRLKERIEQYALPGDDEAEAMLSMAAEEAARRKMAPYYMYRQKYMRGNLENVGYAKAGHACLYNVDMMEETHNILALGSGGMSRRMFYDRALHTRLADPKDVATYLKALRGDLLDKKRAFFTFDA